MLTIQFGQCGNQLGHELFTKISEDIKSKNSGQSYDANYEYSEASCERWFSGITKDNRRIARAILVDTERKVLGKIRDREQANSRWRYSRNNEICLSNSGGSGNNWSYGYFIKARQLEADITEAVRNECEKADRLDGFLGLLGSAGGTGSGVGSRMIEIFRDEYPTKTMLATIVLPFTSGEIGTQNYNGLLTLGKFVDYADALILLENDQLLRICTNSSVNQRKNAEERCLHDMNEVACEKILSVFQPIRGVRNEANFFVSKMAAHPGYKITTIKSTLPLRFTTKHAGKMMSGDICDMGALTWQIHVKQLKRTLRNFESSSNFEVMSDVASSGTASAAATLRVGNFESRHHTYRRSVTNMLITRGCSSKSKNQKECCKNEDDTALCREHLSEDALYARWSLDDDRITQLHENRRFLERDKFVALVTNNSQICETLDGIADKAWNCYTHAAYLHKYKQFGLEEDDFLRAFAKIENVIKLYRTLDNT